MKRLAALLISAVLLTGTASAATLKPAVTVDAGQILLGDLFEGLTPEQAMRPVMAAPAPGNRTGLDAPTLTRIASVNGVKWSALTGADRIIIERASVEITTNAIIDSLRDAVREAGGSLSADIQLDNRSLSLFLPTGNDATVRVENLSYDPQRARLSADIVAPATGREVARVPVGARVVDMIELPVLSHRLSPGDVIGDGDITYLSLPRDRLAGGFVSDPAEIIGKTLRRAIAPNQAVNVRDIRDPVVVGKGQMVTVLLQSPNMTLTTSGKSLSDGAVGELVRIVNTSSNRVIEAVVAGPNLVTVNPSAPVASYETKPQGGRKTAAR